MLTYVRTADSIGKPQGDGSTGLAMAGAGDYGNKLMINRVGTAQA